MAFAEPVYRLDAYPEYDQSATAKPAVRAHRTDAPATTPTLVAAAKMAAVVLLVVAALAFARIALTSATVTTLIESDALSSQIQEARSTGVGLEMEQSVLSNPSAVKAAAKKLGMAAPGEVGVIALTPDVVAVNADGELSLSQTVKNLAGIKG